MRGNKNDDNNSHAIAEAATQSSMRFTRVKTVEPQDIEALDRLRSQRVNERTALCNQFRAFSPSSNPLRNISPDGYNSLVHD
ncbi:MAG: transposase [Gammaproteobacteria bacterium]|nr:transposase [Gammaproteobacteria bacterium]